MTGQGGTGMTSIGINGLMALYRVVRGLRIGDLQNLFCLRVLHRYMVKQGNGGR